MRALAVVIFGVVWCRVVLGFVVVKGSGVEEGTGATLNNRETSANKTSTQELSTIVRSFLMDTIPTMKSSSHTAGTESNTQTSNRQNFNEGLLNQDVLVRSFLQGTTPTTKSSFLPTNKTLARCSKIKRPKRQRRTAGAGTHSSFFP